MTLDTARGDLLYIWVGQINCTVSIYTFSIQIHFTNDSTENTYTVLTCKSEYQEMHLLGTRILLLTKLHYRDQKKIPNESRNGGNTRTNDEGNDGSRLTASRRGLCRMYNLWCL